MNDNQVIINKHGIIEIKVRGDQTVRSVQAMGDEAVRLADGLRQRNQPALILDNLLEMGVVPVEARRRVAELVKSSTYDRLAMLGAGTLLKIGANLILQASGRGNYVRYFDNRTAAIAWLKGE